MRRHRRGKGGEMNYDFDKLLAENKRLRASNKALVAALEDLHDWAEGLSWSPDRMPPVIVKARAAIAAAKAEA